MYSYEISSHSLMYAVGILRKAYFYMKLLTKSSNMYYAFPIFVSYSGTRGVM